MAYKFRRIWLVDGSSISQGTFPMEFDSDFLGHVHTRTEDGKPLQYEYLRIRIVGETTVLFCKDCGMRHVLSGHIPQREFTQIGQQLVSQGVAKSYERADS